jgi:hypothetical protein
VGGEEGEDQKKMVLCSKIQNVSKVTVLFTSVANPGLLRVRRLRNVRSSGSSDESLAKV